jgi:hypothetical protein
MSGMTAKEKFPFTPEFSEIRQRSELVRRRIMPWETGELNNAQI